ncbi:MAG: hypothetical protein M0018_06805 [Nitrospiraceae bacterium]|nr:hypothetical protein [Nitrospiraceae bacterium]
MTITKTLPLSMALHLALVGAIVAASGNAGLWSGGFIPGPLVVNLEQPAPDILKTAPAIKQTKPAVAPVIKEKAVAAAQAQTAISQNQTKNIVQAQTQDPRAYPFQGARFMPMFQPVRTPTMWMWRPFPAQVNLGLLMQEKTLLLNSLRQTLSALLTEKIKDGSPFDGATAKILLSYGADGKLSGVRVSSVSDGLKTLLEAVDWQAAPLPSAYKLSFKGLALNIKMEGGVISIGEQAL